MLIKIEQVVGKDKTLLLKYEDALLKRRIGAKEVWEHGRSCMADDDYCEKCPRFAKCEEIDFDFFTKQVEEEYVNRMVDAAKKDPNLKITILE